MSLYETYKNYGRKVIYTDEREITADNVIGVLMDVIPTHDLNAQVCDYLINYEAGLQPLTRTKEYRKDINVQCVDNIASQITEFKVSYNYGNAITFVARGSADSGIVEDEPSAISLFNECYESEFVREKTQTLARFVEICGQCCVIGDIKRDWVEGDSYFDYQVLDPRTSFIVYSNYYIDSRPMMGVTYRYDKQGNRYFTVFTKDRRYEIEGLTKITNGEEKSKEIFDFGNRSGERNPLGMIPMVEYIRSDDRMGCFERMLSECDNLNLMVSDYSNGVEQLIQSIWHTNDVDFPIEEVTDSEGNKVQKIVTPKSNDWVQTYTTKNGKKPFITPLVAPYDFAGMLSNITARRSWILEKSGVPQTTDKTSSATGVAMSDAIGWTMAEMLAQKQQNYTESAKMQEARLMLAIIKKSPYVASDSPLLKLRYTDVQPNIKRQKSYELTVKVTAFATGVSHGIDPASMIRAINLFDDPNQVIADSEPYMERYLSSIYDKQQTVVKDVSGMDYSAQVSNSPTIDGNSKQEVPKENPEKDRRDNNAK